MSNTEEALWNRWKQLWKRADQADGTLHRAATDQPTIADVGISGVSVVVGDAETIRGLGNSDTVAFEFECDRQWEKWRSRVKALNVGDNRSLIEVSEGLMAWLKQLAEVLFEEDRTGSNQSVCESNRDAIRRLLERNVFLRPEELIAIGILGGFWQRTRVRPEVFSLVVLQHCRLIQADPLNEMLQTLECDHGEYLVARKYFAEVIDSSRESNNGIVGNEYAR